MKKTKIVCTLGPSTDSSEVLEEMLAGGMDLARFNFSHGDNEERLNRITLLRQAEMKLGRKLALVADTKGPELRLGEFAEGSIMLSRGESFSLTTEPVIGNSQLAAVNYNGLAQEVKPGVTILLDDGKIALAVEGIEADKIITRVLQGGVLASRKRVAVPGVHLNLSFLSASDKADLQFAMSMAMDYVAASFVSSAEDVRTMRRYLGEIGAKMKIIAKIENAVGVKNIDEIIAEADGIMVARGDLGVEIPAERVPLVQKDIIRRCNKAGKPVITATQMLESMGSSYRATRAEASDVANAIFDGSDALMLSGETALGKFPVEALNTMRKIALATEAELPYEEIFHARGLAKNTGVTDAISHATVQIAQEIGAAAIITITESGYTAGMIAKYRPKNKLIAVTPEEKVLREMRLFWGVEPILGPRSASTDELIELSCQAVLKSNLIADKAQVVVTAGVRAGVPGSTNLIKIK